jgi:hypothetical protein
VKIMQIAAAALIPAAVAGVTISAGPAAQAAPVHRAARATAVEAMRADFTVVGRAATAATQDASAVAGKAAARVAAIAAGRQAAAREAAAQAQQNNASPQPLAGGMSAFEQCVAWRESTDTPTDPDGLFGILPSTWAELGYPGTAGQASVALQKVAFNRLYAEYGPQPWAPSDGC